MRQGLGRLRAGRVGADREGGHMGLPYEADAPFAAIDGMIAAPACGTGLAA